MDNKAPVYLGPTYKEMADTLRNAWKVSGTIAAAGAMLDSLFYVRQVLAQTADALEQYDKREKESNESADNSNEASA